MTTVEYKGGSYLSAPWVCTQKQQEEIEAHWNPEQARMAKVHVAMSRTLHAGYGVPGWENFTSKVALGTLSPTGLAEDPRKDSGIITAAQQEESLIAERVRAAVLHLQQQQQPKSRASCSSTTWAGRLFPKQPEEVNVAKIEAAIRHELQVQPLRFVAWIQEQPFAAWELAEIRKELRHTEEVHQAWVRAETRWDSIKKRSSVEN